MRTDIEWRHADVIRRLRSRIWLYLTPGSSFEEQLQAGALLQLPRSDVVQLANIHFLLTPAVGQLLKQMPTLLRRLATTTVHEEEWSAERVRGAIRWPQTYAARAATGMPHLHVTSPARRAYQTPENELLVFVLDRIVELGNRTGWLGRRGQVPAMITERVAQASKWSSARSLQEVDRRPVTARSIARIRSGRQHIRYSAAIACFDAYRGLAEELDRGAIRRAIEEQGFAIADDPALFEAWCLFFTIEHLHHLGWQREGGLRLVKGGGLTLRAKKGHERITIWYQRLPDSFSQASLYRRSLLAHGFTGTTLLPDLVLRREIPSGARWLIVEVKLYRKPDSRMLAVDKGSRAALQNLLAYGLDYGEALPDGSAPFGLGVAWGRGVAPKRRPISLTTPDHLPEALADFVG